MKSKKGQEGIIVTVLLILVAIAAVGAVAYFIINNIKAGTTAAQSKINCVKLDFTVTPITAGATTITVKRGTAGSEVALTRIDIWRKGVKTNSTITTIPGALETSVVSSPVFTTGLAAGDYIELSPVLADNTVCDLMSKSNVLT